MMAVQCSIIHGPREKRKMIYERFTNKFGEESLIVHLKSREIIVISEAGRIETYQDMKHYLDEKSEVISVTVPDDSLDPEFTIHTSQQRGDTD
jgi:hypothetical protein